MISHTGGTIVDVQVCGDTDTGRKVKEGVAAERLIQDSSEKTAVYDTVVTAECSTKMDDGLQQEAFLSAKAIIDDDPVGREEHTDCFRFIFFGEKNRRDGEFTGTTEGAGSERVVDFLRIVLVIRS